MQAPQRAADGFIVPLVRPQPHPQRWLVSRLGFGAGVATAITRVWDPGDTADCRLCHECTADHEAGVCLVLVDEPVPFDEAPTYSSRHLRPVGPSGPGP